MKTFHLVHAMAALAAGGLYIINDAGHTGTEPGIADAMVRATDGYLT